MVFAEGSRLEAIGVQCFQSSGLREITFPRALKEVHEDAFYCCDNLTTVYVEEGCAVRLSDIDLYS